MTPLLALLHGETRFDRDGGMIDLLFWFLVAQTFTGLPGMQSGTEVMVVSHDLWTIYARATVAEGELRFDESLSPGQEVRILIFPPGASEEQRAEALAGAKALPGRISDDGSDILVQFQDQGGLLSLRKWLVEERSIRLVIGSRELERRLP